MKKFFSVYLMLVMCLNVFVSCGSDNSSELSAELESLRAENEELKQQATETTETTTTIETTTTTVEKTTTTSETEEVHEEIWKLDYYVDDFERPTDDAFVFSVFNGKFSNLATNDSALTVTITANRYINTASYLNYNIVDDVGIKLFEYNDSLVKNYHSDGRCYYIQVLEENGNIIEKKGYMASEGDTIRVRDEKDQNNIINALKNNDKLTFRIDKQDSLDTYLFDVDCTGFRDLFESTDWKLEE